MDNTTLIFNDDILGLIRYRQTINFFNLDSVCFKHVLSEFRKVNDTVEFTDKTIESLGKILTTIKQDALFYHKQDFTIVLDIKLSAEHEIDLHLFTDRQILPFMGIGNDTNLFFEIPLSELNSMTDYVLYEKEILHCKINTGFLAVLKQVDSFLDYDNSLYECILKNGLYPKLTHINLPSFKIGVTDNSITFQSFFKGHFGSSFDLPFFKIHIYDGRVSIRISGTEITLTQNEFLNTPHQDIIAVIMGILKIKNLPITSMGELKDYILIQDMSKI